MKESKAAANSGFKKLAVTRLNEHWFFVSSAVLADSFVLRNRQLLKPANRWAKGAQHLCPIGAPFAQLHAWSKLTSLTPSAHLLYTRWLWKFCPMCY